MTDDTNCNAKHSDLLKDEYLLLQSFYEDFDHRALTIKGWAITICLAGIAFGFQYKAISFWILSAIASLIFWSIEAMWKSFQYSHAFRIKEIESYFRGEEKEIKPFQIYNSWYKAYSVEGKLKNFLKNFFLPRVFTPHLFIIMTALLLSLAY